MVLNLMQSISENTHAWFQELKKKMTNFELIMLNCETLIHFIILCMSLVPSFYYKQGWNFIHNPNTLVARLFKAKYFPHGSYLSSSLGSNPSFVWRSVWSAKEVVNRDIRWRVGDGNSIDVWSDAWVRDLPGFRVGTTPVPGLDNLKASDLLLDAGR